MFKFEPEDGCTDRQTDRQTDTNGIPKDRRVI